MANPEHVELVRKEAKAISEWQRKHYPDERLALSKADLSGADLHEAYLHGADLSEAKLNGANLSGAHLFATNLSGAILTGAMLGSADLTMANLSRADLSGAKLIEANLLGANLRRADLSGADLSTTRLTGADLSGADLSGADLNGADLIRANLSRANLSYADLSRADVSRADLFGANLSYADLSRARLWLTSLGRVDLSGVKGLTNVVHLAPSSIGVDTLIASVRGAGGQLTPELTAFFRSAGVPEELLKEVPRIVAEIKYYSCFISYGQHDLEFAKKLTEDLRAKGVSCWLWETDKTVGQRTQHEIEEKLEEYEKIVVLCSIHSLLGNGIRREIDRQLAKDREKLVPVSLEDGWKHDNYKVDCLGTDLKPFLIDRNYADFASKPYGEALTELLKGLRRP